MKKILILCLLLAFSSYFPSYAIGKKFIIGMLESWIGYPLDDVILVWGVPTTEQVIAGHHYIKWINSSRGYIPQYTYGNINGNSAYVGNYKYSNGNINTTSYGGYSVQYTCERILEIDENNIIIHGQVSGNLCPTTYFAGKSLVNPKNNKWEKKKYKNKEI